MTTPLNRLAAYDADILGLAELATVLGISKQAANNRRARGKLPEPHTVLAMSPIWTKAQVLRYLQSSK